MLPTLFEDALAAHLQERAFVGFTERALALRIAVAVADQLVATRHAGGNQLGAVVVQRSVDEGGSGQAQAVKQFQAAPGTHTVAIFAPAVIQHIGLRADGANGRTQTFAKSEMFDVETEVNRQARAVGPAVGRASRDRRVVESTVRRQRARVGGNHSLIKVWPNLRAPSATRHCRSTRPYG